MQLASSHLNHALMWMSARVVDRIAWNGIIRGVDETRPGGFSFGERLTILMRRRKLTQPELGEALGVSRFKIAAWQHDQRFPDAKELGKLADLLLTNAEYMLGRTEDDRPSSSIWSRRTTEDR